MTKPTPPVPDPLDRVREALDNSDSFEAFQDALTIPDEALPDLADVKNWSTERINDNWQQVSAALQGSRFDKADDGGSVDDDPPPRLSNGQQLLSRNDNGPAPMSIESIRQMTPQQINDNWQQVQAVLGGAR